MNDANDQFLREITARAELLKHIFGQAFDKLDEELRCQLQTMPLRQLEKIYSKLRKLGIPDEKIVSSPMLLDRDPAIMQRSYNFLVKAGFSQQFIVKNAEMICLNPNLLENPDFLGKLRRMYKSQSPIPEGDVMRTADLVWKRSREKTPVSPARLLNRRTSIG